MDKTVFSFVDPSLETEADIGRRGTSEHPNSFENCLKRAEAAGYDTSSIRRDMWQPGMPGQAVNRLARPLPREPITIRYITSADDLPRRVKPTMKTIESFDGDYNFLSNFYPCEIEFEGAVYPSVEHAFVAAKTLDPAKREIARATPTAGQVKRLGRTFDLREDWQDVKVSIMRDLLVKKFQHEELRVQLLATGDAELVEGNNWGDTFWGVCNGTGKNTLGQLLMAIRTSLKTKSLF